MSKDGRGREEKDKNTAMEEKKIEIEVVERRKR